MDVFDPPPASATAKHPSASAASVIHPIDWAQERVQQEQVEVAAEQDAFDQFVDRVTAIEPVSPPAAVSGDMIITERDMPNPMAEIRDAYRETVMAVDHYDREYGESLPINLRAEAGADVATVVCDGSARLFTPQFKQLLANSARQSYHERGDFLGTLQTEADSLSEMRERLTCLVSRLEQHTHSTAMTIQRKHGDAISTQLETLVEDRQHCLHSRSKLSFITGRNLCTYLYKGEDWTYPVLRGAALLRDVVEARQR